MDVARLNFSHGSHEEKIEVINHIRKVSDQTHHPIAIIADLQGPKIRLGKLEGEQIIKKGEMIVLSSVPAQDKLPLQFDLTQMVKKGHRIFINDGLVELEVTDIQGKDIITIARTSGWVSSHKGVNIPDTHFSQEIFTEKDREDLEFALERNIEYIALSFVQTPDDLQKVRTFIKARDGATKIIVKIERKEAIDNLEGIIKAADAVMIARGDLAVETDPANVPILQQRIIKLARQMQRPVIVATQMLESMVNNPLPTRAEASDVGHAVMSQVDAVMLSAESAAGKYPVQAVKVMRNIIQSVEKTPEFSQYIKVDWEHIDIAKLQSNAITSSAASLSYKLHAPLLAVATSKGGSAVSIASFRPKATIVAIAHDEQVRNQLNLVWGLYPFVIKPTKTSDTFWDEIAKQIRHEKLGEKDDKVVMVGGTQVGVSGATDTIKVVTL